MGFNNPSMPWSEVERLLSGGRADQRGKDGRAPGSPSWNGGGDGPALSRKRQPYEPPPGTAADITQPHRRPDAHPVAYAELHCHSNFSFLDGASHPEQLVEEADRLGLQALALTDHNGFYGVVRFAEAARAVGLPTVFGTEVTLTPGLQGRRARTEADTQQQVATGLLPDTHAPDRSGRHLVVLADGPDGYGRLARALSLGHLAGEKGVPMFGLPDLADAVAGRAWVLTGCRKGAVPHALEH
ncbi:MAG: error-prone polymerase, partial [Actinomycetota bacterium]